MPNTESLRWNMSPLYHRLKSDGMNTEAEKLTKLSVFILNAECAI